MNPLQIVYAVISVAMLAGVGGYIWHCHSVTAEYAAFKDGVEKAGKKAQAEAKKKETDDKAAKEKADAERKKLSVANVSLAKQLHNERSRSSAAPEASPTSRRPDLACFDRGEFNSATRRLDEGLSKLAQVCDQRTIDLNNAKTWAQETRQAQP